MAVPQLCRMCLAFFYFLTWCRKNLNTHGFTGLSKKIDSVLKKN
jgi:hypothetical protein